MYAVNHNLWHAVCKDYWLLIQTIFVKELRDHVLLLNKNDVNCRFSRLVLNFLDFSIAHWV